MRLMLAKRSASDVGKKQCVWCGKNAMGLMLAKGSVSDAGKRNASDVGKTHRLMLEKNEMRLTSSGPEC